MQAEKFSDLEKLIFRYVLPRWWSVTLHLQQLLHHAIDSKGCRRLSGWKFTESHQPLTHFLLCGHKAPLIRKETSVQRGFIGSVR
jgi:hypothetical protein